MRLIVHGARGSYPTSGDSGRIEEILKWAWGFFSETKFNSWAEAQAALNTKPFSNWKTYGGHTTCIEVQNNKPERIPLMIDAGTGLGEAVKNPRSYLFQAEFMRGMGKAHFLMTHTHWDHVIALPTFTPLFVPGNEFHFYSPLKDLGKRFEALFDERFFPVKYETVEPQIFVHQVKEDVAFQVEDFSVTAAEQNHPGGSYRYKIKSEERSFVFASDVEVSQLNTFQADPSILGADVLMMDAHYFPEDFKPGFGHSHFQDVVDYAIASKVKTLYLCHINPEYSDKQLDIQIKRAQQHLEKNHRGSPLTVQMAFQGLEIIL
jgi:phosphoribosyl 1,2-cyclic phosphodiesterase